MACKPRRTLMGEQCSLDERSLRRNHERYLRCYRSRPRGLDGRGAARRAGKDGADPHPFRQRPRASPGGAREGGRRRMLPGCGTPSRVPRPSSTASTALPTLRMRGRPSCPWPSKRCWLRRRGGRRRRFSRKPLLVQRARTPYDRGWTADGRRAASGASGPRCWRRGKPHRRTPSAWWRATSSDRGCGPPTPASAWSPPCWPARKCWVIGSADQPHSFTYVPDLAAAMIRAAQTPSLWNKVWHAPTGPAVTQRQLAAAFTDAGGVAGAEAGGHTGLGAAGAGGVLEGHAGTGRNALPVRASRL